MGPNGNKTVNSVPLLIDDAGQLVGYRDGSGIDRALPGADSAARIYNPQNIRPMLAAIMTSLNKRVDLGMYATSLGWGVGSSGATSALLSDIQAFRTKSFPSVLSKLLNQRIGGTFSPGAEPITNALALSASWAAGSGASLAGPYQRYGIGGNVVQLAQGTGQTLTLTDITGSTVKVWADASGTGVVCRVSINGGADTDVTGAATATSTGYSTLTRYEFTVTGLTPGSNTLVFKPPVGASQFVGIAFADLDYVTSNGLRINRMCNSGQPIVNIFGESLDSTDAQPSGQWSSVNGTGTAPAAPANRRTACTNSITTAIGAAGGIVMTDVNDIYTYAHTGLAYGYTLADQARHLDNVAAAFASRGLTWLGITAGLRNPTNYLPEGNPYNQDDLAAVWKAASDRNSNMAYLDLNAQWGSGSVQTRYAKQLASSLLSADGLHWSEGLHAYNAAITAKALLDACGAGAF